VLSFFYIAPIPHFHTSPIDVLIPPAKKVEGRKSWWGQPVDVIPSFQDFEETNYSHSRSRSVGSEFFNPYHQPHEDYPLSINTGQSLLLTQKFVYQSPSIRHKEVNNYNPFHRDLDATSDLISPFDDEYSSDDIDSPIYDMNQKPNTHHIPPPPVPSQLTKPAFPKYGIRASILGS
jgi:hypothetical protein